MNRIELISTNIVLLSVDAIVNAANSSLLGGGGVDGAIHRAAGRELVEECQLLNGCNTGEAKITKGYNLPAKFVIHTAGPVWRGGNNNEIALLTNCYLNSLKLAVKNKVQTLAFPNISTGIYGFPKEKAAEIAIQTVQEFLKSNSSIQKVYFVTFDEENFEIYSKKLA